MSKLVFHRFLVATSRFNPSMDAGVERYVEGLYHLHHLEESLQVRTPDLVADLKYFKPEGVAALQVAGEGLCSDVLVFQEVTRLLEELAVSRRRYLEWVASRGCCDHGMRLLMLGHGLSEAETVLVSRGGFEMGNTIVYLPEADEGYGDNHLQVPMPLWWTRKCREASRDGHRFAFIPHLSPVRTGVQGELSFLG